jgi:hypothetical protein
MIPLPKERTWSRPHHVITVFVYPQVVVDEVPILHFQVLCDPFDIGRLEAGGIAFTAIATLKTIDLFKRFLMQIRQCFQYSIFICPVKKVFIQLLPVC